MCLMPIKIGVKTNLPISLHREEKVAMALK
jgi:hypothetical protein